MSYTEAQVEAAVRAFRNQQGYPDDPALRAEVVRRTTRQQEVINGITLAQTGVLSRTVADIVSGKRSVPTSQLNPEQRNQLELARLNDQARAGQITAEQYQERISDLNQKFAEETGQRSIDIARRAAPGLRAAATAEAQRFADLATVDFGAQQAAQTKSLEKVASDLSKAGFDPANLTRAQGRPNVNAAIKITTPAEKRQSEFARAQVARSVESVTPSYGIDVFDSKGIKIASNVKTSGGFTFNEIVAKSATNVLGSATGKTQDLFGITLGDKERKFKTKEAAEEFALRTAKPIQGPMRELPSFVKNAFFTFDDPIGPNEGFRGLVGKDFFDKSEFVSNADFLGVPPKTSSVGKTLNRLTERSEILAFDKTKDPLSQFFLIGPGKLGVSITTSIFNLAGLAHQGLEKLISGKDITTEQVNIPRTYEGEYLGTQAEGIFKAVTTGDKSEIIKANIEAERKSKELFEKQGPFVSAGEILTGTIGIPFTKLSPIKGAFAKIPTETGPKILGGTLKVGYGKLSTPIVSRIEGKFALGSGEKLLGKTTFQRLSPAAVDVTTGRALKAFELATVKGDVQGLLTSKKGLQSLVEAGKIRAEDVSFLQAQKQLAELASLGQKKLGQKELLQVDELPRGGIEGLETIAEEEVIIEKIIPKLKPVKGSQLFLTQLRKGLTPTGFKSSDIDIDYIGGLLGERYATNKALKMTRQTVQELNNIMTSQRGAVAKGSKVFTGIIEGVVFPRPKQIKLKGEGTKVMELLTKKDAEEGINSILSDQSKIFGISKSRKTVKTPTGYRRFLGLKKTRKEVPLPTQLLNQISSATRIQVKGKEDVFAGGKIPFLKPQYTDLLRTKTGFRVGPDVFRLKDLVRQQPVAIQIAELLEGKGYTGKVAEVKSIFETIKRSKPEIDFDAAYKEIEKIGESENIESIVSYYARQSKGTGKGIGTIFRLSRPQQEQEQKQSKIESLASISTKQTNSILPSISVSLDRLGSVPSVTSRSTLSTIRSPSIKSPPSVIPKPSRASRSTSSSISFSGISGRSIPSIASPVKVSVPSLGSPSSPSSPGSPTFRSPPFKSPPKSPTIRLPIIRQPVSEPPIRFPKIGLFLFKFDQFKSQRLPSYGRRRVFVADIADPKRPGTFAPKGVKKLISSSPDIYRQIDKDLAKARRNRKAFDPLTGFKISKSGKDVYSTKNLLGKFTKFKI